MDVKKTYTYYKKISLVLIFFGFLCMSCKEHSDNIQAEVIYTDGKATAIHYSKTALDVSTMNVYLDGHTDIPVLGVKSSDNQAFKFEPVIPFSEGKTYLLYEGKELLTSFTIDEGDIIEAPKLVAIYPTSDVVPENLLKMYFQFSKPMQEVDSAIHYITVFDESDGKEVDVFLELPTELWNKDHTRLTLWLDPGRIKTDLIPNKEKGLPIINGHSYKITVSSEWRDSEGIPLQNAYTKQFKVIDRDSEQPKVSDWEINVHSNQLELYFNEPMDGVLAKEVIYIKNAEDEIVEGDFKLINKEETLVFNPKALFESGRYTIVVASKLEDLAGNNLNHMFDNDLTKSSKEPPSEFKTLLFTVE